MKYADLSQLTSKPNTHNPKIMKKVLIENGQIPRLTNLTRATFPPGELASTHSHADMYEIFLVEKGTGTAKINGKIYPLKEGTCITVEPHDRHEFINSSNKDLILLYLGITL